MWALEKRGKKRDVEDFVCVSIGAFWSCSAIYMQIPVPFGAVRLPLGSGMYLNRKNFICCLGTTV